MTSRVLIAIGFFSTLAPAIAQDNLAAAPTQLALRVAADQAGGICRRLEMSDPLPFISVSLHRTFHDDFDLPPLASGNWTPHYAGGAAWPEAPLNASLVISCMPC